MAPRSCFVLKLAVRGVTSPICPQFDLVGSAYSTRIVEQRIGRLDRIGQTETIKIHVPYFKDTVQEALLRFYNEGLNAFELSLQGEVIFRAMLENEFLEILKNNSDSGKLFDAKFETFIKELAKKSREVRTKILRGRDALCWSIILSVKNKAELVKEIADGDEDHQLEKYLEEALDYFGILYEEMSPSIWKIAPGPNMITDALPAILPEADDELKKTKGSS